MPDRLRSVEVWLTGCKVFVLESIVAFSVLKFSRCLSQIRFQRRASFVPGFFWVVFPDELFLRTVTRSWFFPRRTEVLPEENSPRPVLLPRFGVGEQLWRGQFRRGRL